MEKRNFSNDIKLFDSVFTFDREDSVKFRLQYLPFYVDKYPCVPIKYDMCHIGQYNRGHEKRYDVLDSFKKGSPDIETFFYLKYNISRKYSRLWFQDLFHYITNKDMRKYMNRLDEIKYDEMVHTESMPYSDIQRIEAQSSVIIDINEQRAGLSPRIMNALGSGKKVITNQTKIKSEIFYNLNYINVIDENNPVLDIDFIRSTPPRKFFTY